MKKSFMVQVFLLAMVIIGFSLVARGAQAATYYVSPSGIDSNNGSQSAPFQTIQQAANIVNPGDTVVVEDGVYSDTSGTAYGGGWQCTLALYRSGTSSAPITFISQNKWGAILDGKGSIQMGVDIDASYVNFKNFAIRNYSNSGIIGGKPNAVNYCTISGNNIHNNAGTGIIFDSNPSAQSNYITIDNNFIHNNGTASAINKTHGIYMTTDSNLNIMNNIFYGNVGGWDIQLYDHDPGYAENNIYIVGNTFASSGSPDGQIVNYYQYQAINLIIEDNIFYNPTGGWAISDANGCGYTLSHNLTNVGSMSSQGCTGTNNILNANPLFVSAGNNDYHLSSSGSPAYQAGLSWSGRTYDADGNPLGNPPDIGAYEFSTATAGSSSTGTATSAQIAPPQLLTPSKGQKVSTTVTLQWSPAKDPAPCSYTLYIGRNADLSGSTPIQVASAQNKMYAMDGGATAFLLFGIAVTGGLRPRRRLILLLLAGVMAAGLLVSCGGGSGGGSQTSSSSPATSVSSAALSYTVSGLSGNTTYYWKVVAQDNAGNTVQSQTGSFQTN